MNALLNRLFIREEAKLVVEDLENDNRRKLINFFRNKSFQTAQYSQLEMRISDFELSQNDFISNIFITRFYLDLENHLIRKDPKFIGTTTELRLLAVTQIPEITSNESFAPLFENEKRQELILARLFLKFVLHTFKEDHKDEDFAPTWLSIIENQFAISPQLNIVERINLKRKLKETGGQIYSDLIQAHGPEYTDGLFYNCFMEFTRCYTHLKSVKSVYDLVPVSAEAPDVTPVRKLIALENKKPEVAKFSTAEIQKAIMENILDGFLLIDRKARILEYNTNAAKILDRENVEIRRTSLLDYLPQKFADNLNHDLKKTNISIPNIVIGKRQETSLNRANGSTDDFEITITNNYTESTDTFTVLLKNITNKNHMLEAIRDAKMNAERTAKAKTTFLSNMSHEIRTPLNVILGLIEMINKNHIESDSLLKKNLDGIDFSAKNLLSIVNDILDFSKIEAGKLTIQSIDFNLKKVMETLSDGFAIKAREKGLELVSNLSPDLPDIVIGDQYRLNQILTNLIGNSIKFTNSGSINIHVEVASEANEQIDLRFKVTDTGIGISQEDMDRIFDSFYQVENRDSSDVTGTGLGLTITKELIHLQNGEFKATSVVDEGSVFEFTLPFKRSKLKSLSDSVKNYVRHDKKLEGLKVLVAEDNKMNQFFIKQLLNNLNVTVDIAENGLEAVEIYEKSKADYDLILMDMHMPVLNGIEAITQIRQSNKDSIKKVPIVACSADVFPEARKKAIKAGIDFYLTKPINEDAIKEVLFWLISDEEFDPHATWDSTVSNEEQVAIKSVDLNMLMETFDNDEEFIISLLEVFVQTTPEDYKSMRHCIDREYYARASGLAHKMKSSFMNLGMTVHGHHLQQIESLIIRKNGLEEAKKHLAAFSTLYTKALLEANLIMIELKQK